MECRCFRLWMRCIIPVLQLSPTKYIRQTVTDSPSWKDQRRRLTTGRLRLKHMFNRARKPSLIYHGWLRTTTSTTVRFPVYRLSLSLREDGDPFLLVDICAYCIFEDFGAAYPPNCGKTIAIQNHNTAMRFWMGHYRQNAQ